MMAPGGSQQDVTGILSESGNEKACEGDRCDAPKVETIAIGPRSADPSAAKISYAPDDGKVSKNRIKKLEKRERAKQKKLERKRLEKEERIAAAILEGRDLEAERRFQNERTLAGDRQRRLDEIWKAKRETAQETGRFQICIDLGSRPSSDTSSFCNDDNNAGTLRSLVSSFESSMREREIASLAQQIRYCYAYNKKSPNPVLASVTGLSRSDETSRDFPSVRQLLERETGFLNWQRRMFHCTEKSLEDYYALSSESKQGFTTPPKIVYLTSDSETTLRHLEDHTIYVIGGIVDRNRLKYATIRRAEDSLGVATARLPLQEYLAEHNIQMSTTKVLTVNHVFDILLRYREHENNWARAFQDVLPSRKV